LRGIQFIFGLATLGLDAFKFQLPEQDCIHQFFIFLVEKVCWSKLAYTQPISKLEFVIERKID
jgi:hypothetical protein